MANVARLARGFFLLAIALGTVAVVLLSLADPGSLLAFAPLALALAFLLSGRRQASLPLIVTGNALAVVAIAVLAFRHLHH